ncbi:2-hydroxy-3-keto-5-methylthiopentenyl-1-phosphate phosphatase [Thermoflavimicrobium dichotomicum]|uniref:2-hydroxy-3-keto-5-methylthiopentenyl-1-phosphate phosphatase n=1 Tax=Thermoflavimicrobium dichotomicum TaxID=46223 RepID=A0A1I3LGM5_9BACL|nr:2-hydroxy-3-keto-5-methylthiopentenyl-1-phosphate phosphatase [Thermoflavimicrobium dichotomicum]SFI83700.1 2-hydroxy-3-keto-5-methylthiopentenyl-1-phosphatephosphatase [Thermoflavimicrobium dichotomicum]
MGKIPVIFCDFDGTITEKDNIVSIMKRFAPPGWEEIKDQILAQQISIRQGVGKLFSLLPSSLREEIVQFVLENTKIREGFTDFVRFTQDKQIRLYVVSGGIDFFVYPVLDGLIESEHIFCNGSDFSGEHIQIVWPYACQAPCTNDCGCCKPTILRKFDPGRYERIVIGDSITDLQAAKLADRVFARDFLIEKCEENGISYTPFHSFYDIIHALERKEERV